MWIKIKVKKIKILIDKFEYILMECLMDFIMVMLDNYNNVKKNSKMYI